MASLRRHCYTCTALLSYKDVLCKRAQQCVSVPYLHNVVAVRVFGVRVEAGRMPLALRCRHRKLHHTQCSFCCAHERARVNTQTKRQRAASKTRRRCFRPRCGRGLRGLHQHNDIRGNSNLCALGGFAEEETLAHVPRAQPPRPCARARLVQGGVPAAAGFN